jgi:hypothetical protein
MSEMIDRIATVVFVAIHPAGSAKSIEENGRLIVPPHLWAEAQEIARAIAATIREPTEAIIDAHGEARSRNRAADSWRAMVDAMLK